MSPCSNFYSKLWAHVQSYWFSHPFWRIRIPNVSYKFLTIYWPWCRYRFTHFRPSDEESNHSYPAEACWPGTCSDRGRCVLEGQLKCLLGCENDPSNSSWSWRLNQYQKSCCYTGHLHMSHISIFCSPRIFSGNSGRNWCNLINTKKRSRIFVCKPHLAYFGHKWPQFTHLNSSKYQTFFLILQWFHYIGTLC